MGKLGIIIQKEYLGRVKTRAFVLGTVLGPIGIALLMFGPALLAERTEVQHQDIQIVDPGSEGAYERIAAMVQTMRQAREAEGETLPLTISRADMAAFGDGIEAMRDSLSRRVRGEEVDGYVILSEDFLESGDATYYGQQLSGVVAVEVLENVLDRVVQQERMREVGVEAADLARIVAGADLALRSIDDREEEGSLEGRMLAGIALIMLLYFMMIFYGQFTMQAVIEDKSSRVVEVMLASVTPTELMAGKVLGQGLVGFTQFVVWGGFAALFSQVGGDVGGFEVNVGLISLDLWLYFGIFFVFGFLIYSLLYAGVGAVCTSPQDAQQFQGVITMMIVLPLLLLQVAIRNPDSSLSTGLSLFPLFTPILMFIRVVVGKPAVWEIVTSIGLMAATTFFAFRLTGKLFRLSLLHFGKAPGWKELVRLLRTPE